MPSTRLAALALGAAVSAASLTATVVLAQNYADAITVEAPSSSTPTTAPSPRTLNLDLPYEPPATEAEALTGTDAGLITQPAA